MGQKQFRGKTDRLALLKYLQNEWKKTPILKKKTGAVQFPIHISDEISPEEAKQVYIYINIKLIRKNNKKKIKIYLNKK